MVSIKKLKTPENNKIKYLRTFQLFRIIHLRFVKRLRPCVGMIRHHSDDLDVNVKHLNINKLDVEILKINQ